MGTTWDYNFYVVGTEGLNTPYFNTLIIHQQFHFLLNLEKFKFTLEYT